MRERDPHTLPVRTVVVGGRDMVDGWGRASHLEGLIAKQILGCAPDHRGVVSSRRVRELERCWHTLPLIAGTA